MTHANFGFTNPHYEWNWEINELFPTYHLKEFSDTDCFLIVLNAKKKHLKHPYFGV